MNSNFSSTLDKLFLKLSYSAGNQRQTIATNFSVDDSGIYNKLSGADNEIASQWAYQPDVMP